TTAANQVNALNFGTITIQKNFQGSQWTNGVDIDIDYRFPTAALGRFDVGASANVLFNYEAQANPSAPYYQYARNYTDSTDGLGNTNGLLPGWVLKPYINNVYGPLTTSLFFNYIPGTTDSFGENSNGGVNPDTI